MFLSQALCKGCDTAFMPKRREQTNYCNRECFFRHRGIKPALCEGCGNEFTPKATTFSKYCSRECYFRYIGERRTARLKEWHSRSFTCVECGKIVQATRQRKYCARPCQLQKERRTYKQLPATTTKHLAVSAVCSGCGIAFTYLRYNSDRLYCDRACLRRSYRTKYGASGSLRKRWQYNKQMGGGKRFSRLEIYERDGWRCGICGRKVRNTLKAPHPQSATIDHIMPLARGGRHTRENVQLAHFICNSRKSDKGSGQLRLAL